MFRHTISDARFEWILFIGPFWWFFWPFSVLFYYRYHLNENPINWDISRGYRAQTCFILCIISLFFFMFSCVRLLEVLYNVFARFFLSFFCVFFWLLAFSGCCMPACICEGHSSVASTHRERDQKFYIANASQQLQQPAKSKPKRSSSGSSSNGSNEKPPQLPPRDTSIYSQDPTVSSVLLAKINGSMACKLVKSVAYSL